MTLKVAGPVSLIIVPGSQAEGFGQLRDIHVLEARGEVEDTVVVTSRFARWNDGPQVSGHEGDA